MEKTYLWMGVGCDDCKQPITDEKNGFTIKDKSGKSLGYLCKDCGEKRVKCEVCSKEEEPGGFHGGGSYLCPTCYESTVRLFNHVR